MNFGEVLSKAWKVVWKHKILWLFGILAGCGAAGSGGNGGGRGSSTISSQFQSGNWDGFDSMMSPAHPRLTEFLRTLSDIPAGAWVGIGIGILLVVIVFSVLFLMLGTLGITGVVKGTSMVDEVGEDEKRLSLKAVFAGLKPSYWKVFLFNLGYQIAGFIVGLMLVLPIILLAVFTCGFGLLLLIPVSWFISQMVIFTTVAMVEEELSIFKAISRAWQVLKKNVGNVILMSLILGIGQMIVGLLLALPVFVSFVPLLINGIATSFETLTTGLVITGILLLISIPVTILLNGVLKAYVWGAWTLTYRRLVAGDVTEPEVLSPQEIEE
ncbi:MAG: hypothetical protein H0S79_04865 [Anaerolineaceae bacterium]|nr:hypothetical protein [Anaerolineaceae bacterium]